MIARVKRGETYEFFLRVNVKLCQNHFTWDWNDPWSAAFVPTIEYGQTELAAGQALGGFLSLYFGCFAHSFFAAAAADFLFDFNYNQD